MPNFHELFAAAAAGGADRTAVEVQRQDRVDGFSYHRLDEMAARTAAWLAATAGIGRGDRCAILAENDANWCAAYLGVLRLGAVAVPLDTAYKPAQVARLLTDAGARVLFVSPRLLGTAVEARTLAGIDCDFVVLHGSDGTLPLFEAIVASPPASPPPPCPATAADPAVILYTSGTTSDPKGVVLTHGNLMAEREAAFGVVHVTPGDCVLGVLPLFHALAQMANLLLPLSIGARVVFLETVNTTELLRSLSERGVTIFACVPQFFYLIHQRVLQEVARGGTVRRTTFRGLLGASGALRRAGINAGPLLFGRVHQVLGGRMRVLITGGARFDSAVGQDLYRMGFDIRQAYGLTETSGAATLMRSGDRQVDSVGHPLPGVEIRIAPPEAGEEELTDGEVLIRGGIVMAGYYNRPDATAAAIRDGWLHTGDLGRLDAEGRLTITGRRKELIVLSSGKNIYPEEIEAHYRQSAYVKELCVLGLRDPGEASAERLYAVVVPDPDVLRDKRIVNAGDLLRFEMEGLSVGLPAHKRVLGYEVWLDPLPRTTTGKLKRFEIERRVRERAMVRAAPESAPASDAERAWAESPQVAPVLAAIAAAVRGRGAVRADANLELDLGLDSMERVELLTELEGRFGTRVPEAEAQQIFTVRELVDAILRRSAGQQAAGAGAWATLLAEDPPLAAKLATIVETRPLQLILYGVLRSLGLLLRTLVRVEVRGREHLPPQGPYLICPNHQSYLDAFVLVQALPPHVARQLFFVGASEYFQHPLAAWTARHANVVPVDPDASLVPAMQAGAYGLRRGRILVLFPEGERSIDGSVRHFKKGAAILAHHLGVPLVPVALDGIHDLWPRNRPFSWRLLKPWRRHPIRLAFGAPVVASVPATAAALADTGTSTAAVGRAGESYESLTGRLRAAVEQLWLDLRTRS